MPLQNNTYIFEILVLSKTHPQKSGSILKFLLLYIPSIVTFLGFTNSNISKDHRLLSFRNFPLLFYQTLPFLKKNLPPIIFLKNKQNFNPHPFRKVLKIQLRLVETSYFTATKVSNN